MLKLWEHSDNAKVLRKHCTTLSSTQQFIIEEYSEGHAVMLHKQSLPLQAAITTLTLSKIIKCLQLCT